MNGAGRMWGAGVLVLLTACAGGAARQAPAPSGWRPLTEWRGYRSDTMPSGWSVVEGVLVKEGRAGDIITREQFADFELEFEWRLPPGGNSGLFYRVTEEEDRVYWTGPEYQLLDDSLAPDGRSRMTAAGAAHSVYPAPAGVVRPGGEWNATRVVVRGQHVEHWLNGTKLLEYELLSPDWETRVAASKFRVWPRYGRAPRGHLSLQGDHAGRLEVRNLRIRTP